MYQRQNHHLNKINLKIIKNVLLLSSKKIGAGLSTSGLAGCGLGIGVVFAGLLIASAINPFVRDDLFRVAMLGFALTEAIALFTLMVTFLVLFG